MTPDELRSLADAPDGILHTEMLSEAELALLALAPDLARLCADMGHLLSRVAAFEVWWSDPAENDDAPLWEDAQTALANLSELKTACGR